MSHTPVLRELKFSFSVHLQCQIHEGLAIAAKFDAQHPSIAIVKSPENDDKFKLLVHSPFRHKNPANANQIALEQLTFSQPVTSLFSAEGFLQNDNRDALLVGFANSFLCYDIHKNLDKYLKEIRFGSNAFCQVGNSAIFVGGNGVIQSYDVNGNELSKINAKSENIFALCSINDGKQQIVAGSNDQILIFDTNTRKRICDMKQPDIVTNLTTIENDYFGYTLAGGSVGLYKSQRRAWSVQGQGTPTSLTSFDIDDEGVEKLIVGRENCQIDVIDASTGFNGGEILARGHTTSEPCKLLLSDYKNNGNTALICVTNNGSLHGIYSDEAYVQLANDTSNEEDNKAEEEKMQMYRRQKQEIRELKTQQQSQTALRSRRGQIFEAAPRLSDMDDAEIIQEDFEILDMESAFPTPQQPKIKLFHTDSGIGSPKSSHKTTSKSEHKLLPITNVLNKSKRRGSRSGSGSGSLKTGFQLEI